MCNIAAYVGNKNALPILLDMIKKQEGLNGGFYSGIATHDGESIFYCKDVGDFANLEKRHSYSKLKGQLGLAHSRTQSGGDYHWAHPFVSERDGEVQLAYVANGGYGPFLCEMPRHVEIAEGLIRDGYEIPCKIIMEDDLYCRISSGESLHMSDVMCQLIYKNKKMGFDTATAMARAFCEMPSEIVGLAISRDEPDRISFSRINKPMFVGFDSDGAYLASCPIAFPKSVKKYQLIPKLSSGFVTRDRLEIKPYGAFPRKVRALNERTLARASLEITSLLEKQESGVRDIFKAVKRYLPKNELLQVDAIVYTVLARLVSWNKIKFRSTRFTSRNEDAPLVLFSLK